MSVALVFPLVTAAACVVIAAEYPSRPVTIVQPFVAGSATDVFTRILAEGLSKELKGSLIVLAKPGGGMAIGANYVANSRNDGYTLFVAPAASVTLNEVINPNLPYRSADFAPVGLLAEVPQVLTVRGDLPIRSVRDLGDYAKARPGQVTLGNGGANTLTEIMAKVLEQDLGVKFNHIPFNGSTAARSAMLGGQIDATMDIIAGLPALQSAGKLRALALLAGREHPALPGVKTFTALGFQRMDREGWFGLLAPKDTAVDIIARLNAATQRVLNDPDVVRRVIAMGLQVRYSSPAELAEVIDKDVKVWRQFTAANPVAK
jgi:tripartite-type tricarboxylate transporter receptor subunit TctC